MKKEYEEVVGFREEILHIYESCKDQIEKEVKSIRQSWSGRRQVEKLSKFFDSIYQKKIGLKDFELLFEKCTHFNVDLTEDIN